MNDKQRIKNINEKLTNYGQSEFKCVINYDKEKDYLRPFRDRLVKLLQFVKVRWVHFS
jgi:hypothetical protein